MRVVLFRHGPAGKHDPERWPDDARRPLSARGADRTRLAAHGVTQLEGDLARILTSPLERAAQSAALLAEANDGEPRVERLDALAPGHSFRTVIAALAECAPDDRVALVGHEPDLGKLAGVLLLGAPAALPLKKAGACCISFMEAVAPGAGRLEWLLPPRALRRLGRRLRKARA